MSLRHLPIQSYRTVFYQIALCGKDSLTGSLDNTKAMGTVGRDGRGRKGLEYLGSQRAATELGQGTWPWG